MIWVSKKKSRKAAVREAEKHMTVAHCYYIGNYTDDEDFGETNWLVVDADEGSDAKVTYQIYGLRWWKHRKKIININNN